MPTVTLLPTEDAYVVGNAGVDNKNFGKDTKLWISSDSYSRFSVTGKYHETAWTYLKFNLGNIKPEWIKSVTLHLFIPDARFVGSTVQVTDLAIRIYSVTPDWSETTITWANKPTGEFIQRVILLGCQETGICGRTGSNQVGGSFNIGHVKIPLLFWRVQNGYISLIIQPGADNNAMWTYSREANVPNDQKPYLEVNYEITETTPETRPEVPEIIEPTIERPETVDLLFSYIRGIRELIVKIGETEKTLSNVGDTFVYPVSVGSVLEVLVYPKRSLFGYRAKIKPSAEKEVALGFPWKIKIKNAEFTE